MNHSFLAFSPNDVKKMIEDAFPYLINKHGFVIYQKDSLIKVSEYVLKGICFERSQYFQELTVTPFIQPLIIPFESLSLALGRRLEIKNTAAGTGHWYQFTDPVKVADVLSDMKRNIDEVALPYIEDSKDISTLGCAKYQKKWACFWGDSVSVDKKRCYIYAFSGQKKDFLETFERIQPIVEEDDRDWAIEDFNRLKRMRERLDDPYELKRVFQECIDYSVQGLKLEKYNLSVPRLI